MKLTIDKIHQETIDRFGAVSMMNKCISEFQESITEIQDIKNGVGSDAKLMEELQDCKNMIRKMEIMFNMNSDECNEIMKNKMVRTYKMLIKS